MVEPNVVTRSRRRWLQFNLRGVFLLMLAVALGLGWIANERRKVWLEDRAVEEIERLGGNVVRRNDYFHVGNANWRRSWREMMFGANVGTPVIMIVIPPGGRWEVLQHVRFMRSLEYLRTSGVSVSDGEVEEILGATSLKGVDFTATNITDIGAMRLSSLPNLRDLTLDHTAITSESLSAFAVHRLESFSIRDTAITETAAERFRSDHPELQSFRHERSPSQSHREAVKHLLQVGATLPDIPPGDENPSPDAMLVMLHDGSASHDAPWVGGPGDLDVLANVESRLCLCLDPSVCTREYVERLARLDTTEELRLQSIYRPREVFECLVGMTSVESLHVTLMPFEEGTFRTLQEGDLDFLARLPNLEDFALSMDEGWFTPGWTPVSQAALLAMTRCAKLKYLNVHHVDIREETLSRIVRCPNLESIEVTATPFLAQGAINRLQEELRNRRGAADTE